MTNKIDIDKVKFSSNNILININTFKELVYAEAVMMKYDGDDHPTVYGHRLLLSAFFKKNDIPKKFYDLISSTLNGIKKWNTLFNEIFTELKTELINYD